MFFDWITAIQQLPDLLQAAWMTYWIALVTFFLAVAVGVMLAIVRHQKYPVFYLVATAYVEMIRNTPILVQIFLIYFGLPQFHIFLPALTAGILALTINNSAYIAEIIRSGIQAVAKGQWEAAETIGLTKLQVFRLIVIPQAIRNIFPALSNQFIMVLFGTSLLSILDVRELTQVSSIFNSKNARVMETDTFVILIYYAIAIVSILLLKWVNRRFFPSVNGRS
jgi:polar amino acid transport system permease protein